MKTMIQMNNICKTYGTGESAVHALNNLSLEIQEGEMTAIMGASGSGKSTLMNIIGLLDEPTSGDYQLNEIDVKTYSAKKKAQCRNATFGFVVQDFALINEYTVKQNIEIPFTYTADKKLKEDKDKIIRNTLEQLGILNKINVAASKLSGGQRQRVAIARALVCNPDIILADEPTGALDTKTSKEIIDIFSQLNEQGKTIIIITHDPKIASYCKKIIEISDGKIISNQNETSN